MTPPVWSQPGQEIVRRAPLVRRPAQLTLSARAARLENVELMRKTKKTLSEIKVRNAILSSVRLVQYD